MDELKLVASIVILSAVLFGYDCILWANSVKDKLTYGTKRKKHDESNTRTGEHK